MEPNDSVNGTGENGPDSGETESSDPGQSPAQNGDTSHSFGSDSNEQLTTGGDGGGGDSGQTLSEAGEDADQSFSSGRPDESVQTCGNKSVTTSSPGDPDQKTFIEIELVDEEGNPVAGESFEITLPDGTVVDGTLDDNGRARADGFDPGSCQITFPDLDKDAWKSA
jgi:hypothetical protein